MNPLPAPLNPEQIPQKVEDRSDESTQHTRITHFYSIECIHPRWLHPPQLALLFARGLSLSLPHIIESLKNFPSQTCGIQKAQYASTAPRTTDGTSSPTHCNYFHRFFFPLHPHLCLLSHLSSAELSLGMKIVCVSSIRILSTTQ